MIFTPIIIYQLSLFLTDIRSNRRLQDKERYWIVSTHHKQLNRQWVSWNKIYSVRISDCKWKAISMNCFAKSGILTTVWEWGFKPGFH